MTVRAVTYQRYCTSINYVEKCRALSVLEKHEICRKWEHAKEKLSNFDKNFINDGVGNYIDPSLP